MHACHNTYVEARGQLAGVSPFLLLCEGSNIVTRVDSKCFSPLGHLRIPWFIFKVSS